VFKKVAFTYYPVTNMDRARAFYGGTLGLPCSTRSPTSPWVEYDLPEGGCLAITTVTQDAPASNAGGAVAFEVEDLDACMDDLKAKGVPFLSDLIHSPVCRMAVIKDPDGNSILLHQLTPKEA